MIRSKLRQMGFILGQHGRLYPPHMDKNSVRQLHMPARLLELNLRQEWVSRNLPHYLPFFADGSEVIPDRVCPRLVEVTSDWQHEVFRLARLLWSIPFSKGYGRRLRFLMIDESNNKLIGLLALQSPPLSFPARDRRFHYPPGRKAEMVNQTMDIQTLGAVPPYDRLLGGKLVALAAASNEVRKAYQRKYRGRKTEIERRILPAHLVALTTTSAFGRSSLYNRLRYRGVVIAKSLGYTDGYGSFHLMEAYSMFQELLKGKGISTRGGFGTGPRIKWQTMIRALDQLGLSRHLLRHGVAREVFLFPLVDNLKEYLEGQATKPLYRNLPFEDLAAYWRERWLLPRIQRVDGWQAWRKEQIVALVTASKG